MVDAARRIPDVRADLDHDEPGVCLIRMAGGVSIELTGGIVICADGAVSAVCRALRRRDRFDFIQSYLEHGHKELPTPPVGDGDFQMPSR